MALSLRENICSARRLPSDQAILASRAALLLPADRELVEAVLVRGLSAVSVARMTGSTPRRVANRIKKLSQRLASRQFLDTARALPYLSEEEAELARLRFCAGISARRLGEQLGFSPHALRRRLDSLAAQITMMRRIRWAVNESPLTSAAADRWKAAARGRST